MNDHPVRVNPGTPQSSLGNPSADVRPPFPIQRSWKIALAVAALMVLLALLGVGLTTTNRAIAPTYWVSLVPVYGLLCVAAAYARKRHGASGRLVLRQVFHWLGIAAALGLDFFIRGTGEETGVAAGYNALLLLALGCFLAGVHLEWPFMIVGLLLATALMIVVKADQYLWLIVIVGVVAVAAMIWLMRLIDRAGGRKGPASQPAPVGPKQ
jgi:hypothetical protein